MQQRLGESRQLSPWMMGVKAYPGESFGHLMGRFRRANHLSDRQLSRLLNQEPRTIADWETPSRRRRPNQSDLRQLSTLVGIELERLQSMFLPCESAIYLRTRLCPQCYQKAPCHQARWQRQDDERCIVHQILLLCECPKCGTDFCTPRYWSVGECQTCGLGFTEMISPSKS